MSQPAAFDADLLGRIPLDARTVLLAGCGTGALGAAFKRRNPAAKVTGIEADPDAAGIAAQVLDHVVTADITIDPAPFAPPHGFDCIVHGDGLNRIGDPLALLRHHAAALNADGVMVVALPNASHWRRLEEMLRGTAGLAVDQPGATPHLLPIGTVELALRRAGLNIRCVDALDPDTDGAELFGDTLAPAAARLGINPTALLHRTAPRRLIWRAGRQPSAPITIVSTMLVPIAGVSHVRVVEPMQALASHPDVRTLTISNVDPVPPGVSGPKIFILHRPLLSGDDGIARIQGLIDDGWLVVCEFDDHPSGIPGLRGVELLNFRAVHAVQTSTPPLVDLLRPDNPEVALFPNAVAELPAVVNYANPDALTLLCAGLNREDETPPYVGVFNAIAAKSGPRLRFQIVGDAPLYEALETSHKSYVPVCDYDTYRMLLGRSEISFMPLRDNVFNRCKSDLKFIEAAAHRVTALASDVVYPDTIDDRTTGLIFASPAELEHNLSRILDNPGFGRRIADNARAYVIQHRMLADGLAARVAWYRSLWERREALTAALLQRVPALRAPG